MGSHGIRDRVAIIGMGCTPFGEHWDRSVDQGTPIPMADHRARIATFTIDRLAYSPSPPLVGVIIDFDGGGRYRCELTDVDPDAVDIGDRVEMTFRRLYTADGVHNYFWKARPLRGEA